VNLSGLNFPDLAPERDDWILAARGERNQVRSDRAFAWLSEVEPDENEALKKITTIFLTNRECPFRCLMCDLWKNTLTERVAAGDIPRQIAAVLDQAAKADAIKLYNSGSFFDPNAIPVSDYPEIAKLLKGFERVIVECHPAFLGSNCLRFQDLIATKLEVAVGLETANPDVLEKLNKGMTLKQFGAAAKFLRKHKIDLRVFVLLGIPFVSETEAEDWCDKSIDFAFECGAQVVSVIPTREGNGAMDRLAEQGLFVKPSLATLQLVIEYGISWHLFDGRIFADLWNLERFNRCDHCFSRRKSRLQRMNLEQRIIDPIYCSRCAPDG
jgi:radical SAM enzyme (TIGR01210 family)